jgi:hypothetical protein
MHGGLMKNRIPVVYHLHRSAKEPEELCFPIFEGRWLVVRNRTHSYVYIAAKWARDMRLGPVVWVQIDLGPARYKKGEQFPRWTPATKGVAYSIGGKWVDVRVQLLNGPMKKIRIVWGLCYDVNGQIINDCVEHLITQL